MTPEQHAVAWWGDKSYPEGPDWQALLRQFEICRDESRDKALDEAIAAVRNSGECDAAKICKRLEGLKVAQ